MTIRIAGAGEEMKTIRSLLLRLIHGVLVLAAFCPIALAAPEAQKPKLKTPNILWLIAEDFGQHLSCYGTKEVWTPNLDRLASQGVRYDRFYNGHVCSPSRSAFNTGMYATTIGAHNHRTANKKGKKRNGAGDQLYNLAEDIGETNNVAAAHPDLVKEMTALLQRIRENGRSRPS